LQSFEGDIFITENPFLVTPFILNDKIHIRTITWLIPNINIVLSKCQYIELDGSFQASYPYVYTVPQAIIHNESIPLGFTLGPTERVDLFQECYDCIALVYPDLSFLWKIPVLTDEGSALSAFVHRNNMDQYLCYKHLLFKFIQNSPLYFLVRRILSSPTYSSLQLITPSIQRIAALIFLKSAAHQDSFEHIFQWSFNPQNQIWSPNPTSFEKQMLWNRNSKGIGTTTNHAERFHRTMNHNTKKTDIPQKKTFNFRNNIVRKIRTTNLRNGRQFREYVTDLQKLAKKKDIPQTETCTECDMSKFRARFGCPVPCIHRCLAFDIRSIPQFEKISMKTSRQNRIHIKTIKDNWGFKETNSQNEEENPQREFEEIESSIEMKSDFRFIQSECQKILNLDQKKIKKSFLLGAYSVFKKNHCEITDDESFALFTLYAWEEAKLKEKGIFQTYLENKI
jgi:hypothetical protein